MLPDGVFPDDAAADYYKAVDDLFIEEKIYNAVARISTFQVGGEPLTSHDRGDF